MAWNVAKLKFSQSKVIAGLTSGLSFGSAGSKMYSTTWATGVVTEYDLGLNYDPFTETYVQEIDVSAAVPFPTDVDFNPTGTKMYVNSMTNSEMHEYDLSVAWDISTAVHLQDMSVSPNDLPRTWRFKPDGTMLYIISHGTDKTVGFSLSTAWDISTMLITQQIELSECATMGSHGIDFKSDGTKMYIGCSGTILEYSLAKAWDIETSRYLRTSGCSVAQGTIKFDSYGNIVYANSSGMHEYTLPIGKHRPVRSS